MKITNIKIKKFRGFRDVEFNLGSSITAIAGQNGTQKTTLLGMLSQPFSLGNTHPFASENPLCGGHYKSAFSEKFKFSDTFDKAGEHEWTLEFNQDGATVTNISMNRKEGGSLRFWGPSRKKGDGYMAMPVIYLSLRRLFPIGEDENLIEQQDFKLSKEEEALYKKWHDGILVIRGDGASKANYISSEQKVTLGTTTDYYDWKLNSSGQDNLGKIILAVLSFRRLKEKYKEHYIGGILVIDEIDATLYPASQLELVNELRRFSKDFDLQIIFTTHSFSIIEKCCQLQGETYNNNAVKVVYLIKEDRSIRPLEGLSFEDISHRLNITCGLAKKPKKVYAFREDAEAEIFAKAILGKNRTKILNFIDTSFSCTTLVDLASRKGLPLFYFPNSVVIIDGDFKAKSKVEKIKNAILLPGKNSPEQTLASFLDNLSDRSELWRSIDTHYSKQFCFKEFSKDEILDNREKAKKWFNSQKKFWGINCSKVIKPWILANQDAVNAFLNNYDDMMSEISKRLHLDL